MVTNTAFHELDAAVSALIAAEDAFDRGEGSAAECDRLLNRLRHELLRLRGIVSASEMLEAEAAETPHAETNPAHTAEQPEG